jgi:hypothetical protein
MFLYPEALPRHPCRGYCPVPCLLSRSTLAEPPLLESFGLFEGSGALRVVVEWTGAIAKKDDTIRRSLACEGWTKRAEVRSTIPSRAVIRRA